MKQGKEDLTRAAVVAISVTAGVLVVLSFGCVFLAAYLQEQGVSSNIYTPIGCLFFVFDIAALILLCLKFPKLLNYGIKRKIEKIDKNGCVVIEGATKSKIIEACTKYKFVEKDCDYLYKRKFSFFKDFVNYFVRIINATDIKGDIQRETSKFDNKEYKNKNKCLLLFLFMGKVEKNDLKELKIHATPFVLLETAVPGRIRCDNAVIVLVDDQSQKAYLVQNGKFGISIYKHGIKMARRLLT